MAARSQSKEPNTRTTDHIVHLTSPASVKEVSEKFAELGFTVIPGGTHSDGLTANALVLLGDGSYLELISFTHPVSYYPEGSTERAKREAHRWAQKSPGWIDYAFLGTGSRSASISDAINRRAKQEKTDVSYLPEVDGGRIRPDGEVLKWLISAPEASAETGTLPFFCGDVTPRPLRVPITPSNTDHPSTTTGVAFIKILTSPLSYSETIQSLATVVGREPSSSRPEETTWDLDTPISSDSSRKAQLLVQQAVSSEELTFISSLPKDVNEIGIYEVGFFVRNLGDRREEASTPYGKIKWVTL